MPPKHKPKPPGPPPPSHKDRIIEAALALAAQQGWAMTTVRDIAGEADMGIGEFYKHFDSRDDIVAAYGRRLDQKVLKSFDDINPETPVRDLIFDILMERFDLANADKPALKSILDGFKTDPKQLFVNVPHFCASMTRMLEAAGVDANGWKGAARITGLSIATAFVTRTWLKDESQDLSLTMAALDKALNRIESLADRFSL